MLNLPFLARCFVLLVSLFAVRSDVGFFNFFGAPFHISFFVLGGFLFDGFFDLHRFLFTLVKHGIKSNAFS